MVSFSIARSGLLLFVSATLDKGNCALAFDSPIIMHIAVMLGNRRVMRGREGGGRGS